MVKMRVKGPLAGGVLLAAAILFFSSCGYAYQLLTLDGIEPIEEVLIIPGEPILVELTSTDTTGYSLMVGFAEEPIAYYFELVETRPEAGTYAWSYPVAEPYLRGYGVDVLGYPIDATTVPGVHFVFLFAALEEGEADLLLTIFGDPIHSIHFVAMGDPYEDVDPPSPDPIIFVEPNGVSHDMIALSCTESFDPSGVEYYFECVSGPGHHSGWQAGTLYIDTPLQSATSYEYRVKARDGYMNETSWSSTVIVETTQAGLIHVPAQYPTIQAAIDAANNGDQIEVAPGIYYEAINFNGKAVKLYSSSGPQVTTINGAGHFHVVQCISGEGLDTVLEGFTITGGNANGTGPDTYGGGMYNYSSSPTVTNCIFRANRAGDRGGGMYNTNGGNPEVINCALIDNKGYVRGSGMCNWASTPTVVNCTFTNNTETIYGGGMSNNYCNAIVANCTFNGNSAIHCGGMHNDWSSPTVTNSIFFGNSADVGYSGTSGGMGQSNYSNPRLTNCTFGGNIAYYGGAMRSTADSSPIVTNCILWGNTANIEPQIAGPANVTYSDIQGGWEGTGNIDADPLFEDADGGNFRLSSSASPCVDTGSNAAPDLRDEDFDGNPRVMDGDENGSAVVDMGAYEVIGTALDIEPPSPDPILSVEPNGVTDREIALVSTEAFDPSGVEYYFECVSGPGHDSNWVSQPLYTDTSLAPETSYEYRVKARDGHYNETQWSPTVWVATAEAGVIHVPAEYVSIQAAIDAANNGDQIEVAPGIYYEAINFNGKAVRVYSSGGPEVTIINGSGHFHVVQCVSGEAPDTILEGFTISNGNASGEGPYGGGIYCDMASPTIKGCIIKYNQAEMGGGIYLDFSSAILEDCIIVENRAADSGGGLMCWKSSPTLINCTIGNNSPDGLHVSYGSALVLGTVKVISDSIRGDGFVRIDPDATLHTEDVHTSVYVGGIGRIFVPAGKRLVVEGGGIVDLTDYDSPGARGTVQCNGLLVTTDDASITRTAVNVTRAIFAGSSIISDNVFTTNRLIPYGQIALEDTATFINNDVYSQGDRYVDIEPAVFAGTILNNRIFVTQAGKRGGLFELRGEDVFCRTSCEPGLIPVESVPDFEPSTWTLERLELVAGAKLTLTNRDDYQAPYDVGGRDEVLYVRQLVLGPNSVLDTSFNRLYYEDLTMHPSAKVINKPLLGFSLDRILFDDANEFSNRVGNNNVVVSDITNRSRIHVERVPDSQLDPSGLMVVRNLLDTDPASPTYGHMMHARAKGLFARCSEQEILIRFRYLFEGSEPGVKLAVYLSDVPELLDKDDPMRPAHYLYVGLLTEPPAGRPGSAGSDRFGVFQKKVPTEHLDLTDGTYVELELIEPAEPLMGPLSLTGGTSLEGDGGGGGMVTIDDWGPEVHCDGICLDITWDDLVDEVDFLTVVGACGVAAELDPNETGSGACLEGAFSDDGYVDALDISGWDWTLCSEERMGLCNGIPLGDEGEGASLGGEAMKESGGAMPLVSLPGSLDDLLIIGKRSSSSPSTKMKDRVYTFDSDGDYSANFAPSSERSNIRIVQGADGQLYQVNSEDGVVRLDASDTKIIEPGECSYADEPRYHKSATVYVGIQGEGEDAVGRPILDAAFDGDYVYVVPVVVNPVGDESYAAAAKLQLLGSGSPPYSVVKLYDDPPPPADNQYRNGLREIEIDDLGNVYVINANSLNESDLLWRYEPSGAYERVELGQPAGENYVPDPVAMYVSSTTDMLYLASAQYNPEDFNDSVIRGFSTDGALSLTRQITIHSMHHATGMTEDQATGMLYVIGFNMDNIPEYPDPTAPPFYEPRLAKVPYGSSSVDAQSLSGSHDLAMPLSISWTRAIKCGRADADGSGTVSFGDLAIIGENWLNSSCTPPGWCSGADINMSGAVGMPDVAILADNWLESGCGD
jgi:hypothetical protein